MTTDPDLLPVIYSMEKTNILDELQKEWRLDKRRELAMEFLKPQQQFKTPEQRDVTERRNRRDLSRFWIGFHCLSWGCNPRDHKPNLYQRHGHKAGFKLSNIDVSRQRFVDSLVHYEPLCAHHFGKLKTTMGLVKNNFAVIYEWIVRDERLRYEVPDPDMQFRIAEVRDASMNYDNLWMIAPTPLYPHRNHKLWEIPDHPVNPEWANWQPEQTESHQTENA